MSEMALRIGDTLSWTIDIPETAEVGSLVGASASCALRGPGGEVNLTCAIISVRDRRIGLFATAAQTRTLLPGYYRYEVVLHWPGGVRRSSVSRSAQVVGGGDV